MERSQIGIVIPALNEENTISDVIRKCRNYGMPIVVDDGSTDHTSDVSRREKAEVVRHNVNQGYDSALNSGFKKAVSIGCQYVVTIDADGQHDPKILNSIISLLEQGSDIVIGIRNKRQRFSEHLFSFITKILYGISDPLCGLKGYRISVYHALGHFDSYNSIGTELALFSVRNGFRLQQIPIIVSDRIDQPRFGSKLDANYKILRAIFLSFMRAR
jgi:glycosyltransferase involved in cell wall biosynthesis